MYAHNKNVCVNSIFYPYIWKYFSIFPSVLIKNTGETYKIFVVASGIFYIPCAVLISFESQVFCILIKDFYKNKSSLCVQNLVFYYLENVKCKEKEKLRNKTYVSTILCGIKFKFLSNIIFEL